jgi:hypothetical protein
MIEAMTSMRYRGGRRVSVSAPRTLGADMKWLLTTFIALVILSALQPWLQKLGIGRLPGDLRFTRKGKEVVLPFTSTVLLSLLLTLLARLL